MSVWKLSIGIKNTVHKSFEINDNKNFNYFLFVEFKSRVFFSYYGITLVLIRDCLNQIHGYLIFLEFRDFNQGLTRNVL